MIPRAPSLLRKDNSEPPHGSGDKDSAGCSRAEHGMPTQPATEGQPANKALPAPGTPFQTEGKRTKGTGTVSATGSPLASPSVLAPSPPALRSVAAGAASEVSPRIAEGVEVDFTLITVHHWDRLFGGVVLAKSRRLPWATLLRRTFEIDVTRCRKCHGADAPSRCDHPARHDHEDPRAPRPAGGPAAGPARARSYVERGPAERGRPGDGNPACRGSGGTLSSEPGWRGPPEEPSLPDMVRCWAVREGVWTSSP